jgi:hypothetical protein
MALITDFTTLPNEVLEHEILARCAEYAPAIRAVCCAWRDARLPARETRWEGLSFLAEAGHEALIVWTRDLRGAFMRPQLNNMLVAACRGGSAGLAARLHEWGATVTAEACDEAAAGGHIALTRALKVWDEALCERTQNRVIYRAAQGGHHELVMVMWEWYGRNIRLVTNILSGAANGGHLELMRQAVVGWGADTRAMQEALISAARGGHKAAMELLCLWGADTRAMQEALISAARGGHKAAMELLCLWGGGRLLSGAGQADLMYAAVASGCAPIVELVWKWYPNNTPEYLREAATGGHAEIAVMLKARGARDYGGMLWGAVRGGSEPLCRLARAWGAQPDPEILKLAAEQGCWKLLPLLRGWIIEDDIYSSIFDDPGPDLNNLLMVSLPAHLGTAVLLRSWGAQLGDNSLMAEAAEAGNTEAMQKLRQWHKEDGLAHAYHHPMKAAAQNGEEDAMKLLYQWGREKGHFGLFELDKSISALHQHQGHKLSLWSFSANGERNSHTD